MANPVPTNSTSTTETKGYVRQKVLIIDDSDFTHDLVRFRLKHDALEIVSASDGAAGIETANSEQPDLILLDVDMPGMDGFEVCRRLKEDPATSPIPILFITAEGNLDQKVRGLALGAADYITKPFDPTELRARVQASLRGKHYQDRLAKQVMVDDLTDLWNGSYFDKQLLVAVAEAKRFDRALSCIMMDIDHLSAINHQHGESAGDEVLRELARRILMQCRAEDVAARLEGGTMAILSPNTTAAQATRFAGRLWSTLAARPIIHRESTINFKCSFGSASWQPQSTTSLLEDARQALKRAKAIGGARLAVA